MLNFRNIVFIVFVLLFCAKTNSISAQDLNKKMYDIFTDTLLIINGKTIDSDRVLMKRQEIIEADTFRVNQKGLTIVSFTMTALTLGHSVELTSDKPILTGAMQNEIINKQSNYKFIYIKNINLRTKEGKIVSPSINTLKIIFSN